MNPVFAACMAHTEYGNNGLILQQILNTNLNGVINGIGTYFPSFQSRNDDDASPGMWKFQLLIILRARHNRIHFDIHTSNNATPRATNDMLRSPKNPDPIYSIPN